MSILSKPYFYDEKAAIEKLEEILWPNGPVCPKCGNDKKVYELKGVRSKPSKKNPEGVERHGLKKCGACRKQFAVRVGTVFESSHVPLHKWFQSVYLMCSSKKGISSHQLHRTLEVTYKTAWFMSHRIREAMRSGALDPMGGGSGIVEVDETYIGNKKGKPVKRGFGHKHTVLSLVEREGRVRSLHVNNAKASTVIPIVEENVKREAVIMTDEAGQYRDKLNDFNMHGVVNHSAGQYVRLGGFIHTNTVEGYFSIFKRGMKGVYQHCSEKHLHSYLAEYDFRYNNRSALNVNDIERTENLMKGLSGKRLLYEGSL